jgi:hypothetical protein
MHDMRREGSQQDPGLGCCASFEGEIGFVTGRRVRPGIRSNVFLCRSLSVSRLLSTSWRSLAVRIHTFLQAVFRAAVPSVRLL